MIEVDVADQEYIVNSGPGYFIEFYENIPFMDSDYVSATRMSKILAFEVMDKLIELGFYAELIEIISVKIIEVN